MDDSRDSLIKIATSYRASIVPLLLQIQQYEMEQSSFLSDFLNGLECFYVGRDNIRGDTLLFREWINANKNKEFVALSYTWSPSYYEDKARDGYFVENRTEKECFESPVRGCVFRRIIKYMNHLPMGNKKLLWIDRHSVPQKVCKDISCQCLPCDQKWVAIQSMDWVYKLSNYPTSLLGRPIKSIEELDLLYSILKGRLFEGDDTTRTFRLRDTTSRSEVGQSLELLYAITSDYWWQRAWTFQENYKAGKKMSLLIPHPPCLDQQKCRYVIFGDIQGELKIQSSHLSRQATRLCKAFEYTTGIQTTQEEKRVIKYIMSRLGRYTILLEESESMSPAIIADVEARGITDPWDRLPIVANCCDYPVRLDTRKLQQHRHSLSLSMLTMYLLNGEILDNDTSPRGFASNMTTSEFLKAYSFNKMLSPEDKRSLAWNKGCRFIEVELTHAGIMTKGHLWRLGQIIHTNGFENQLPSVDMPRGDELDLFKHKCLTRLCQVLRSLYQHTLATCIEDYLFEDAAGRRPYEIGENYMYMMAREVASAIEEGKSLRLGRLQDAEGGSHPCTAIFVWDNNDCPGDGSSNGEPEFAFTSLQPKDTECDGHDANDTHRHVSLQVDSPDTIASQERSNVPRLYTKRWLLGMCFFVGYRRRKVVFPWPPALRCIAPNFS